MAEELKTLEGGYIQVRNMIMLNLEKTMLDMFDVLTDEEKPVKVIHSGIAEIEFQGKVFQIQIRLDSEVLIDPAKNYEVIWD